MTDTLQANYLTVNLDGTIGAFFPGGVQMTEAQGGAYQQDNALGWLDGNGRGVVRQFIQGQTGNIPPISHGLLLMCNPDTNDEAFIELNADESGPAGSANIQLGARDSTQNPVFATLFDSDSRSSFLQLLSAQQLQLAFGSASFIYAGGTTQSNTLTIAHGLGRSPQLVLALPVGAYGTQSPSIFNFGNDATNVKFQQNVPSAPAAGAFGGLWWAAIG